VALIFILYRKEEVNLFSTVSSNNPVSADELLNWNVAEQIDLTLALMWTIIAINIHIREV